MLQAFRLELQYAAMKRKQQHEKLEAEEKKNTTGEGSSTNALSKKEVEGISAQADDQQQGTGEVSDKVYNKVQKTISVYINLQIIFSCCHFSAPSLLFPSISVFFSKVPCF
jgi:hypothetical protein